MRERLHSKPAWFARRPGTVSQRRFLRSGFRPSRPSERTWLLSGKRRFWLSRGSNFQGLIESAIRSLSKSIWCCARSLSFVLSTCRESTFAPKEWEAYTFALSQVQELRNTWRAFQYALKLEARRCQSSLGLKRICTAASGRLLKTVCSLWDQGWIDLAVGQ